MAGFIVLLLLPIYLGASLFVPLETWADWVLYGVGFAIFLWLGVRMAFGKQIQHGLALILALFGISGYNLVVKIYNKVNRGKKLKAIQDQIPEQEPVAKKSVDLVRVHPKILRPDLAVIIGYNQSRRPVSVDLSTNHTLIGASTGGGKTTLINSILIQLFSSGTKAEVYIIDLKGNIEDGLYRWGAICNYVDNIEDALELLRGLVERMNERQRQKSLRPILVIIDEVADMTQGSENREYRQSSTRLLSILARKARSARINLLIATQHPRYDVLDKAIAYMLMRKICLVVDTGQQAEVVLGFGLNGSLPKRPGEFVLKDGIGIQRGRTLLVKSGEVDLTLSKNVEGELDKDPRIRLWKVWALGKKVGDNTTGIHATYKAHPDLGQEFIKEGKRHLANAGVLEPPKERGESYQVKVEFWEGINMVRRYIKEGKWQGAPEAFVKGE